MKLDGYHSNTLRCAAWDTEQFRIKHRNAERSFTACEWMETKYLKTHCGQNLEVNEDVADRNQDGLTG